MDKLPNDALVALRAETEPYDPPPPAFLTAPPPKPQAPRVQIERADWREEERERAQRQASEREQATDEETHAAPASTGSATPNLDAARRMLAEVRARS